MDTDNDKYWRDRTEKAEARTEVWEEIAGRFAGACDIDGFGHVRNAHMGELTQALKYYLEYKNGR